MTSSTNDSSHAPPAKNSSLNNEQDIIATTKNKRDDLSDNGDIDNSTNVNDLNSDRLSPEKLDTGDLNTKNSDRQDLDDEEIIETQEGAQHPESKITMTAVSKEVVIATIEEQEPESQQMEDQVAHELETELTASASDIDSQRQKEVEINDNTAVENPSTNDKNRHDKDDSQQTRTEVENTAQSQAPCIPPTASTLSTKAPSEPSRETSESIEVESDTDKSLGINDDNTDNNEETVAAKEPLAREQFESKIEEDENEQENIAEKKEAKLESYKQFVAEQFSHQKVDYPEVRVRIEANALPSKMYFVMNILSAIIASYGLVTNSAAVVIGAMLVAMMLGPITGIALAIIDHRAPLLRKSLFTVIAGVSLVVLVGFLVGWLHKEQPLTAEILSRTQPTSMDLMIALAGGTAGAYAMVSPHLSVAVVGVAVATALVPPLAASGILFANGETQLGLGALLLAITNIIAIQFTNALVLWILGFRRLVDDDYKSSNYLTFLRRNAVTLLLLVGLGIYLSYDLNKNANQQAFENNVKTTINSYFIDKGNVLTNTQFDSMNEYLTIRAVIRGETTPSSYDVRQIEAIITQDIADNFSKGFINRRANELPIKLQLRYLPVQVIESSPLTADKLDQTDAAILTN